jgi:FlaA1/EpsC-like NDP-sugar epimerase
LGKARRHRRLGARMKGAVVLGHLDELGATAERSADDHKERREKLQLKENQVGKLEGKIALITGGNSGIGLATAKRFVSEGAYVFITGRRESELAAAVKEIGGNVTGVQGDVSDLGDLDRLFAQISREKGRLDIVFANAGVARYALTRARYRNPE